MVVDQLLLFLLRHVLQGVVVPFQIPVQGVQTCKVSGGGVNSASPQGRGERERERESRPTLNGEVLDGAALSAAAVRRQAEAADAAAGPDPRAQNVVWIQVVSALEPDKVPRSPNAAQSARDSRRKPLLS